MLKDINNYLINAGNGLLAKIKFDFSFKLDTYSFLTKRYSKHRIENKIIRKGIYNK